MRTIFLVAMLGLLALTSCNKTGRLQTTEAGNQYIITANGDGSVVAEPGYYAYIHARMAVKDSVYFDTRANEGEPTVVPIPTEDTPLASIGPVEDVLRGKKAGDEFTVIYRIDTLEFKPPGLEDEKELRYEISVVEVVDAEVFSQRMAAKQEEAQQLMEAERARGQEAMAIAEATRQAYDAGTLAGVQTKEDGLKYIIHEEGSGTQATAGNVVSVHYIGMLMDGTVFDQSFERGQAITFPLGQGQVIFGWDEGIALLKEGSKASLFIPADLGYGAEESGPIPANSELYFYVELRKVE